MVNVGDFPYQGTVAPWFIYFDDWSFVLDMSDDGRALCGETPSGQAGTAHGQGVRWDWDGSWPPKYVATIVPFPTTDTEINPALGISPDGINVVGDNARLNQGNDSAAYTVISGTSQLLPFLPGFPSQAEGVAVANGNIVVGHINRYDSPAINRTALTVGAMWRPQAGGTFTPLPVRQSIGDPNPTYAAPDYGLPKCVKLYDVTADGRFTIGGGSSAIALQAYTDPGLASEAVMYTLVGSSTGFRFKTTWLGFPPGIARNYSRAVRIASDSTNPKGVVVVGTSGGFRLDRNPNPSDRHSLDQRPTAWRVMGNNVTAQQLPLLKKSWSVPQDAKIGGAGAVSRTGDFIVGQCGTSPDFDTYDFDAVIWGREAEPRSIREILMDAGNTILINAGNTSLNDVKLDGATGVSADGSIVCGYGYKTDGTYFGWVAKLPQRWKLYDWTKIPRKLPNKRWHPLLPWRQGFAP